MSILDLFLSPQRRTEARAERGARIAYHALVARDQRVMHATFGSRDGEIAVLAARGERATQLAALIAADAAMPASTPVFWDDAEPSRGEEVDLKLLARTVQRMLRDAGTSRLRVETAESAEEPFLLVAATGGDVPSIAALRAALG